MSEFKIMLVDDEPHMVLLTQMALHDDKLDVFTASGGEECLKALEKGEKPDLILLDVMMPVMNGYSVCEKIKSIERLRETKVYFYTAMPRDEIERNVKRTGADGFIEKSISIDELKACVEKILRGN